MVREVYDRDIVKLGTRSTRRSTTVVLPVPDGAETMKSKPRSPSLDILDLLAHLLELRLRGDDDLRHVEAIGLGAHRIDFAVHFLEQEVELPPTRLRALAEHGPVGNVRPEA